MASKKKSPPQYDNPDNPFAPKNGSAGDPFKKRDTASLDKTLREGVHLRGKYLHRCCTDEIGHSRPRGSSPTRLILDSSEGFIPLWKQGSTLRWRFSATSFVQYANPEAAKEAARGLLTAGLMLWGDAVPIRFKEVDEAWDFEVVMKSADDCDASGCTLAQAFFPDQGRHKLYIFPKNLTQSAQEQAETLAHEFGHIFGLRHFFAKLSETEWSSELFGKQSPFTIMNYGEKSVMTARDRSDLKKLYKKVWSGEVRDINGTPIRLVQPYHTTLDA